VIPALNESRTIVAVVAAASRHGTVIVVDDGSSDDTAALARGAGARVVSHGGNRGYDAALNSGLAEAARLDCDAVITLDADGQHDPALVTRFIEQLQAGADVVLGVRDQLPRFSERLFALYARARFGIPDPLCGMKAYRMPIYRALGHFDSYGSIGTELMLFAARRGYSIAYVPFNVLPRQDSPRFGRLLLANWRILRAMVLSFARSA
jgi:glycosyltransferase involved in cell wall biosynthesis